MIRFDYNGKLYGIQFKYGTTPPVNNGRSQLPERRTIECKILVGETVDAKYADMTVAAVSTVTQDTRDVFVKAEGRKRALTKTLRNSNFDDKIFRTKLWFIYHERTRSGKIMDALVEIKRALSDLQMQQI